MPSINWRTARAEIVTILTGVAITDPIAASILRVYAHPKTNVTDFPCVMIVGVSKGEPERSSGLRSREYTARLRLMIEDADLERQDDLIDSFEEAIIDAFDQNLTLNAKVSNLNGPLWLEPGPIDAGGQNRAGVDGLVRFTMDDSIVFAG